MGVSDSLKPNDRNVIAVTVENDDGEEEKFVIASLRLEHVEQVLSDSNHLFCIGIMESLIYI